MAHIKKIYLKNKRSRLTDTENRLIVTSGESEGWKSKME